MSNLIHIEYLEKRFDEMELEKYFNQLKGIASLSIEHREYADQIRCEKNLTSRTLSSYSIIKEKEFEIKGNSICIDNHKLVLNDRKSVKNIRTILVYLLTVEERVNNDKDMDVMLQYFNNMWNYAALQFMRDEIITKFTTHVEETEKSNISKIFAPGYYTMSLSENKPICELLNAQKMGVYVNEQYMLQPENTLCGIVFQYKEEENMNQQLSENPCKYCKATEKQCGFCTNW